MKLSKIFMIKTPTLRAGGRPGRGGHCCDELEAPLVLALLMVCPCLLDQRWFLRRHYCHRLPRNLSSYQLWISTSSMIGWVARCCTGILRAQSALEEEEAL